MAPQMPRNPSPQPRIIGDPSAPHGSRAQLRGRPVRGQAALRRGNGQRQRGRRPGHGQHEAGGRSRRWIGCGDEGGGAS